MKNIKEVQSEVTENERYYKKQDNFKDSELRRAAKKNRLLRDCIMYLETNPKESFVNQMLDETKRKLEIINNGYSTWWNGLNSSEKNVKNLQAKYDTEMETKKVKFQIKVLKYLLA